MDDRATEPMDLSATTMSNDRSKKGSFEWRTWCHQNNACFECGIPGHNYSNYKKKSSGSNSGNGLDFGKDVRSGEQEGRKINPEKGTAKRLETLSLHGRGLEG
jgi:hypothetical protein